MAELDILTQIHTKLDYIAGSLEKHIEECHGIRKDFIRPLWEDHMQQKGMAKMAFVIYSAVGGMVALIGAFFGGLFK